MTESSEKFIQSTGGFGKYQIRLFCIAFFAMFSISFTFMVMTFTTAEPPWRCVANATACKLNGTFKPGDDDYEYRCKISRSDWEFVLDGEFDSIVTEWDLVCDTAVYPSIVNSLIFVTMLLGASLGSILGDKFGRKTVALPSIVFLSLCGFISAFSTGYWMFALCRFLMGFGIGAGMTAIFLLLLEFVGPEYRGRVGAGINYAWGLAVCVLSLVGYLIQRWRTLTIIASVPGLLLWVFWWFTPESLRWLITKGKIEQAKALFRRIAQVNKRNVTDEDVSSLEKTSEDDVAQTRRLGDIRDLFSNRALTVRTLFSWFGWVTSGLVYYGIFLGAPSLGGNIYLNLFITSACEFIGTTIVFFALDKFGRRKAIMANVWIAAVAMVVGAVLAFYDDGSQGYFVGKILATQVVGLLSIVVVFNGFYIYSSEIFPTVVRNTGLGTSSAAARIGSGCAPYIVYSVRVHPLLPCGIMAIFPIVCGLLFFLVPETYMKPMPDILQQVESNKNDSTDSELRTDKDNNGFNDEKGHTTKL